MDILEQKVKRLKFLNELYNRGIESVSKQIERHVDEIFLIRVERELKRRQEERDSKLKSLIDK